MLALLLPIVFLFKAGVPPLNKNPETGVRNQPSGVEAFTEEKLSLAETLPEKSPLNNSASGSNPVKEDPLLSQFLAAQNAFNSGNYAEAAKLFKELSAKENEALLGLGISLYALKDFKASEKCLLDYLVRGKHPLARKTLAFIYYDWDNLEKAEEFARESLMQREDPELRRLYEKIEKDILARGSGLKESTNHFTIVFDGYSQGPLSRQVLGFLEEAYSKIGSEMGYFPDEPVTVILYGKQDFYDVTEKPDWAGGVYDGKIRLPVRGADMDEKTLRSVLFHEYTHALVHELAGTCPVWINEGLAEYFSRPCSITIGQSIPLEELNRPFSKLPAEEVQTAYLESYSAVKYLMGQYGAYKMKLFLERLGSGAALDAAFSEAFYQSYDDFIASWGK